MSPGSRQRERLGPRLHSQTARLLRDELVVAQRGLCGICGDPMLPYSARYLRRFPAFEARAMGAQIATLDHVVPRSVSRRTLGNVVAAHKRCNERKRDRMPTGCELIWLAVANVGLG